MTVCTPDGLMELLNVIWLYLLSIEHNPVLFWVFFTFFVWHLLKSVARRVLKSIKPTSEPRDDKDD